MKFAKLFEMGDDQLLVTKDWNEENDSYEISMTSDINDLRAELKLGYQEEDKCNEYFDLMDQEEATHFYNKIKSQVENLQEG